MVPVYDGVWRIVSASGEGYSLALRNDSSVQREVRMNWRVTFLILMSSLSVFPFSGQADARCELARLTVADLTGAAVALRNDNHLELMQPHCWGSALLY